MQYDPYKHAEELGIEVIHRRITSANGLWLPDHQTIVLREGMRTVWDRCVLSHEIAHAELGHRVDRWGHEIAADVYAAGRLIHPEAARDVMRWAPDVHRAASELGVTTRLLRAFVSGRSQVA